MKKSVFLIAFVVVTTLGYAQTSSGNMMLGGGLMISSTSGQDKDADKISGFSLRPGFGYFVSDNFAVGAELGLSSAKVGEEKQSSFSFGPFARYYIFTSNEKFGFFGQAQLAFGTSKEDGPGDDDVIKGSTLAFAVSPGAAWFFNEHWALEFAVHGLSVTSTDPNKDGENDKYTTVAFGLSTLQPSLGFRYHF